MSVAHFICVKLSAALFSIFDQTPRAKETTFLYLLLALINKTDHWQGGKCSAEYFKPCIKMSASFGRMWLTANLLSSFIRPDVEPSFCCRRSVHPEIDLKRTKPRKQLPDSDWLTALNRRQFDAAAFAHSCHLGIACADSEDTWPKLSYYFMLMCNVLIKWVGNNQLCSTGYRAKYLLYRQTMEGDHEISLNAKQ